MKETLAAILVSMFVFALTFSPGGYIVRADTPETTTAVFTGVGSGSSIYSRYYSRNVFAGILEMEVDGVTYDGYCIDLYTPISVGDILIVNGPLSEDIRDEVNWCAVNYIIANYDYTESYGDGHPLANLNQSQRAAAIQAAIWYLVTEPYPTYENRGADRKYQFMTDPDDTTNYDARPLRAQALAIVDSVPENCDEDFLFPTSVELEAVGEGCGDVALTVTVYDQNGDPLENTDMFFETDKGSLSTDSATTDGDGEASTTLSDLEPGDSATVWTYATGDYGTLLYDENQARQSVSTLTLLPRSVGDFTTVICQEAPAIEVKKYVSSDYDEAEKIGTWLDADNAPGLLVPHDGQAYYKFVVTNTGNVGLTEVTLIDSEYQEEVADCDITDPLPAGDSSACVIGPVDVPNTPVSNTATVTGKYNDQYVNDSDDAWYTPTYTKSGYVKVSEGDAFVGQENVTVWLCIDCPAEEAVPCTTLAITLTDENGHYEFPNLPPGGYVVSVPAVTNDENDYNEQLFTEYRVIEDHKVAHHTQPLERACIIFDLTADEADNNFYFERIPPVGGTAYPANKLAILAPWLALFAAMVAGVGLLVLRLHQA